MEAAPAADVNAQESKPYIVGNQNQAAAALGISVDDFKTLRDLEGFPGEPGRYNIPEIRAWMGDTLPDDVDGPVPTDAELGIDSPPEPEPIDLQIVDAVAFPLCDPRPGSRYENILARIDVTFRGRHRRTFRRLIAGMVERGDKLADGTPVRTSGDVLRWILEQLEPLAV